MPTTIWRRYCLRTGNVNFDTDFHCLQCLYFCLATAADDLFVQNCSALKFNGLSCNSLEYSSCIGLSIMLSPVCILTDLIVLPLPMKISSAALIFHFLRSSRLLLSLHRGGSRTAATSKMERFVIIVNGWKPLTIITKRSILDVVAVLDPSLLQYHWYWFSLVSLYD